MAATLKVKQIRVRQRRTLHSRGRMTGALKLNRRRGRRSFAPPCLYRDLEVVVPVHCSDREGESLRVRRVLYNGRSGITDDAFGHRSSDLSRRCRARQWVLRVQFALHRAPQECRGRAGCSIVAAWFAGAERSMARGERIDASA